MSGLMQGLLRTLLLRHNSSRMRQIVRFPESNPEADVARVY